MLTGWKSTIQLVSPLTKEQVSSDNGGGGNWSAERGGDINKIKTIAATTTTSSSSSSVAFAASPVHVGETKSNHFD